MFQSSRKMKSSEGKRSGKRNDHAWQSRLCLNTITTIRLEYSNLHSRCLLGVQINRCHWFRGSAHTGGAANIVAWQLFVCVCFVCVCVYCGRERTEGGA